MSASTLRRVLDARDLRIVYQPVVDLTNQAVFAYEALVRTKPADFESPVSLFSAAVAESCTGELGRMLRQMSIDNCTDHPLFLNIHPAELNEKWIVQPDDPIYQHGRDVYLEITESSGHARSLADQEQTRVVHEAGDQLAIELDHTRVEISDVLEVPACPELFVNQRDEPLSRSGVEHILDKYVAVASVKHASLTNKRVSPHVLRHTCAMHTLQATRDIRKVALWLGHANVQTTEIYLRADPSEKLDAIEAVIPASLRRGRFRAPDKLIASLAPIKKRG